MKIQIDLKESLEENANQYFNKSKQLKNKIKGAKSFLDNSEKKLKKYEKEVKTKFLSYPKQSFEKFHFVLTRNNHLAYGGKDATTNEIVVKKHLKNNEIGLHSEMPGSPFFVVNHDFDDFSKNNKEDLEDVAKILYNYSKAFSRNLFSGEVYYVKGEQISKEAKSGEFMSKGSFMIYGNKNFIKTELGFFLNILIMDEDFFTKEHSKEVKDILSIFNIKEKKGKYVKIFPTAHKLLLKPYIDSFYITTGSKKKSQIANSLMKRYNLISNQDIISILPNGQMSIKEV